MDLPTTLKTVGCLNLLYMAWALVSGGVRGTDSDGCPELFEREHEPNAYWSWVVIYALIGVILLVISAFVTG